MIYRHLLIEKPLRRHTRRAYNYRLMTGARLDVLIEPDAADSPADCLTAARTSRGKLTAYTRRRKNTAFLQQTHRGAASDAAYRKEFGFRLYFHSQPFKSGKQ